MLGGIERLIEPHGLRLDRETFRLQRTKVIPGEHPSSVGPGKRGAVAELMVVGIVMGSSFPVLAGLG